MIELFLKYIDKYDKITIFAHFNADGDALGSQWAMKSWLDYNYPNKEVYVIGDKASSLAYMFPYPEEVSDQTISDSLALVLDTATQQRISDQRATTAKTMFKIDHHINVDQYGEDEIVVSTASSTCELLTTLFLEKGRDSINETIANYLYIGLLTDTGYFSTTNTSAYSLEVASILASYNIDISKVNRDIKQVDLNQFKFQSFLLSKIVFEEELAYVTITSEDVRKYEISHNQAKECVYLLNNIKGIRIWCLFLEDEFKPGIFNGSLRSFKVPVNKVANKYSGGGHLNASGVRALLPSDIELLLNDLRQELR